MRRRTHGHGEELSPILQSIAKEIDERTRTLDKLETRIDAAIESWISGPTDKLSALFAEAAVQRRALRCAILELDRLGCSIVRRNPLTLRLAGDSARQQRSYVWQHGTAALRLA